MIALNNWKDVNESARTCVTRLGQGDLSVMAYCAQLAQQLPPRGVPLLVSDSNFLRPIDLTLFTATASVNGGAIALGVIFGLFVLLLGIGVACAFASGTTLKRAGGYTSIEMSTYSSR